MNQKRISLTQHAMHYGTSMGIFWIISFAIFVAACYTPSLFTLFVITLLCVPVLAWWMARDFRDKTMGGYIHWIHAWSFTTFIFLFAGLLAGVAHYIFFAFIDHGMIMEHGLAYYTAALQDVQQGTGHFGSTFAAPEVADQKEQVIAMLKQVIDMLKKLQDINAINLAVNIFTSNIFYGSIISLVIALIVQRKPKNWQTQTPFK